jgi:hypothetical protein
MNHMLWPTVLGTAVLFWLGLKAEPVITSPGQRRAFVLGAVVLAAPAVLFCAYYTKLLGEPVWLYEFRSLPGTELSAAGVGLIAGFFQRLRHEHPRVKRQVRTFTVPAFVAATIVVPYLKPILLPLDRSRLREKWKDGICLQSTSSTCGPASAATIVRALGGSATEAELARDSLTYAGGTENWYLARALRKRGFHPAFELVAANAGRFPTPSVAGVKMAGGAGHFIALLGHDGTRYVASDPLSGRFTATHAELTSDYHFTGFFLVIR